MQSVWTIFEIQRQKPFEEQFSHLELRKAFDWINLFVKYLNSNAREDLYKVIKFYFYYENFEALTEDNFYMGLESIFSSLYFPNEIFSCNYFQTK